MDFVKKIAASDVTDADINRLQVGVLYSRGALKKDDRLEVSRTLGVLRAILSTARSATSDKEGGEARLAPRTPAG